MGLNSESVVAHWGWVLLNRGSRALWNHRRVPQGCAWVPGPGRGRPRLCRRGAKSKVPHPSAVMLPVLLSVLVVAVPFPGLRAPLARGDGHGQGEGWIPVPSWAGESCVALLKCHLCGCVAVFRQMPGDSGSCSGGWLPPLWVPRPRAAAFVDEEASLGETGSCCLWMKGLTSKHLLLAAGFCLLPHVTTQGCVPPRGCTAGSLLCFAPAEFQGKALCKPKGKCGEEGDAGICISHLSPTRV